jgi:hypothetical protein
MARVLWKIAQTQAKAGDEAKAGALSVQFNSPLSRAYILLGIAQGILDQRNIKDLQLTLPEFHWINASLSEVFS